MMALVHILIRFSCTAKHVHHRKVHNFYVFCKKYVYIIMCTSHAFLTFEEPSITHYIISCEEWFCLRLRLWLRLACHNVNIFNPFNAVTLFFIIFNVFICFFPFAMYAMYFSSINIYIYITVVICDCFRLHLLLLYKCFNSINMP